MKRDSFWGDFEGHMQRAAQRLLDEVSRAQRDLYMVSGAYQRTAARQDYRNGYYGRDFVTKFGTVRLRIARTRGGGASLLRTMGASSTSGRGHWGSLSASQCKLWNWGVPSISKRKVSRPACTPSL